MVKGEGVEMRNCRVGLSVDSLFLFRINEEKLILKRIACFNWLGAKCFPMMDLQQMLPCCISIVLMKQQPLPSHWILDFPRYSLFVYRKF